MGIQSCLIGLVRNKSNNVVIDDEIFVIIIVTVKDLELKSCKLL